MHGTARCSRYPSDSSRAARSGLGTLSAAESRACLVPPPSRASYPHQLPIGARAMPASHDRMTIAVRSAPGPCPLAMAVRYPTTHLAIGPSPLAIAYAVGRAARWWAGSPGRTATVTQWGGPGPAMSMPDGSPTVSTQGVRRCARRAQHLAASAGLARGAGSPAARGRDATGTPGRARPLTTNYQPHHLDDSVPHCCYRRDLARSSWGPARQSGRPGPNTIRAGPGRPAHATRLRHHHPPPPTHPATGPLTSARRARNVTRRRLGWRRAHWPRAGRSGLTGTGRTARDSDHGPIATSSLRLRTR